MSIMDDENKKANVINVYGLANIGCTITNPTFQTLVQKESVTEESPTKETVESKNESIDNAQKSRRKKDLEKNKPKPRETMTLRRKPEVTEAHLKLLFLKLAQEKWISGNEADFCALFSGKRDEDCVVTWLGKYGKGTLVELFQQFVKTGLVILPEGFTLSSILEGHFKDKDDQWLTRLDKGDAPAKKALPVIAECVRLLKVKPDRALA